MIVSVDDDDESIPEFLQEADVPIIDGDECRRAYEDDFPIDTEAMLCAGYQQGGKDTCLGTSGISSFVLIFGTDCSVVLFTLIKSSKALFKKVLSLICFC